MEGKINVDEDQMIFTSIPYDESWIIKIDGKEVKPVILLDSLMGIECSSGEHSISLEYKVNLTIPIIISLSTLSVLVIKGLYNIKFRKNIKKHLI